MISTLVTAGLYLLVRSSPILEYSPTALLVITLIGSTTAFVAALCGLVQNDIKRIIAFSTISQLGYFTSIITFIILCLNYLSTASSFVSNLYCLDLYILLEDLRKNTMWSQTLYLEDLYLCVYVLEVYFSLVTLNYIINYLNSVLLSLMAQDLKYFLSINILFPSVDPCYLKNVSTDNCNLLFVNLSSKAKANKLLSYLINTKSISSSVNGRLGASLVDKVLEIIGKSSYQQDLKNNLKLKDKIVFLKLYSDSNISYKDKFTDFSYSGRSLIKNKYNKTTGIYLWVHNKSNRSYVGKSVNLYQIISKYLSPDYINKNKLKMAICSAISKYGLENFTLYILEVIPREKVLQNKIVELTPSDQNLEETNLRIIEEGNSSERSKIFLSLKENYWFELILPSYNIQSILQPFTGSNHYRFGKKVPESVKLKISSILKGRIKSQDKILNHISGARKKPVYFYDYHTQNYITEFEGLCIAARVLNLKDSAYIRYRLDKDKPIDVTFNNRNYKMLFKSKKINNDT